MKTNKLLLTFSLCILIFLQTPAWGRETLTLTLNDADILDLVRWAQDLTTKTILVHPNVKGKITVIAGDPMTQGEAYQVFLSVLDINGFSAIESGSTIRVIPKSIAKQSGALYSDGSSELDHNDVVVKLLALKNASSQDVLTVIKPLVPQEGYIAAYPKTNSLIVIDQAQNIREIIKLIEDIDKNDSVNIEMVRIEFADAKEVASTINSLIPAKKGGEKTSSIGVDKRSNSLFITGDPHERQLIKRLITNMDQPLQGSGNTQVIYLSYAKAKHILPILTAVGGSEQKNNKDSSVNEITVNIQADDATNSIIMTAPPSLLSTLKGVIKKLDIRRGQVMVEAIIVEVNEDISDSIGVEWNIPLENSDTGVAGGFSSYPSKLSPLTYDNGELSLGTGLSLGYLLNFDIRGLLNILRGQANANILSTPTIMALDNEEAQILVGENVPFITGSQKQSADQSPFQTIERQDIGISLKILPKINNTNSVTLEIHQKVESIGSTDVQTADIITNKREIKTKVLVDNQKVLVLGGLMRDEIQISESRVPLLSRIPLLGRLFRSKSSSKVKRNLLVFIRPTILESGDASSAFSLNQYEYIREKQIEFNGNQDQPILPELQEGEILTPSHPNRPPIEN